MTKDSKNDESGLTEKEEKELDKIVNEMEHISKYINKKANEKDWIRSFDASLFSIFSFSHTKALVKHSMALNNLTRWLKWLTIALILLTLVDISFRFCPICN